MNGGVSFFPTLDQQLDFLFADAFNLPEAKSQETVFVRLLFQSVVPIEMIDVDGSDLHAVLLCIDNELGGLIKTHRHTIEQGAGEYIGIVALEPRGNIHQQSETYRVAFGKAVAAKTEQLFENPSGIIFFISVPDHSFDQLLLEMR